MKNLTPGDVCNIYIQKDPLECSKFLLWTIPDCYTPAVISIRLSNSKPGLKPKFYYAVCRCNKFLLFCILYSYVIIDYYDKDEIHCVCNISVSSVLGQ